MLPDNPALNPFYEPKIDLEVSWLPSTWLWLLFGLALAYWLGSLMTQRARRWWTERYRREALKRLQRIRARESSAAARTAHELLKIVAIHCLGRSRVTSIAEIDWYLFLNTFADTEIFDAATSEAVYNLLYRDAPMSGAELENYLNATERWLREHEVTDGKP